ncbi:MAG: DNA translocase FtsK, partial [bacterium]|nr:DNA translocase FtsK [bacterium]
MAKKKNNNKKSGSFLKMPSFSFELPEKTKRQILGIAMFLASAIVALSFFHQAGPAGQAVLKVFKIIFGKTSLLLPLIFATGGFVFFTTTYEKFLRGVVLGTVLLTLSISAIFELLKPDLRYGGYLGYAAKPIFSLFGFYVTQIIFLGVLVMGVVIFWNLLRAPGAKKAKEQKAEAKTSVPALEVEKKPSLIQKFFLPKFKVNGVEEPEQSSVKARPSLAPDFQTKDVGAKALETGKSPYKMPPIDLLDPERGSPTPGDIRMNSAIIKKTLENFGIPVEMSDVSIGPTVTQYSLKPADGIKLTRITTLSNDLALALSIHPIRIEAPIPGKPLVGIEVPNKTRAQVKLRDLVANPQFQNSPSALAICLGKDVSGSPVYADLAKMPHLLVAGSTGTGKSVFLNNLILSFLYRNGPDKMRLILVDPKRVEFPVFAELPHLLCPPILDSQKTVNALKWLVSEMERRFEVLSGAKTRDIKGYNEAAVREGEDILPYIVVVIDELADLMAARGKEVEAGIVRLAQMARAVGIHLIVATQRPSVEVITGLIKANIIARVTFQVASQIDSRTVL